MRDPRLDQLAAILVNYSTGVKKDDLVRIGGEIPALPLIEAIHEQTLKAGAHAFFQLSTDNIDEALFRLGSPEQLSYINPINQFMIDTVDVYIGVRAPANTKSRSNVSPDRQTLASKARKPFLKSLFDRSAAGKLRWVGTQFPTPAAAQDAEMSLHEYTEFLCKACLLHLPDPVAAWKALSEKQQRLVDFLSTKKEIRVIAPGPAGGTDLLVGVEGRTWINCDGKANFPDGEVFTGPIETATSGTIRYSFAAVHQARECHDITLTFKAGKVVDATASKGAEFLLAMIDQDEGARTLGEFAIGTNFGVTQYTKNTLFDEKIGGTIHAALGAAYPESGGKNESALHWDMVCDLRHPGAKLLADGEIVLENGRFTNPAWPNP